MNKKIIYVFTFALTIFLMIGAASAIDAGDGNINPANNDQTFAVGFNGAFPPFEYLAENGQYIGFDLDLAKEVAKRNNWTFKAQPIISWDTKEVELNSDVVDCIWSGFTVDGRENQYTWSNPYFNNSQVIVVKSDSNINSIDDLNGKTVEAMVTSSAMDALNENKTLKDTFGAVNEIGDYEIGFMDLESGVCDALIIDIGCAKYNIVEKYSNESFKILDNPVKYEKYGVAFKKGNDGLKNQVQKTLDEMFKDGTVDKIAQNYSDYGIPERLMYP